MIFAFDIDETTIFSEDVLDRCGYSIHDPRFREVDFQFGKRRYMLDETHEALSHALTDNQIIMVPCTARCLKDCKAINWDNLEFDWYITSLGTMIWYKGVEFQPYLNHLKSVVSDKSFKVLWKDCHSLKKMFNHLQISDRYAIWARFDKDDDIVKRELTRIQEKHDQFDFYFEDGEVSILPRGINKGYALKWLKEYLDADVTVSIGDSKHDATMFEVSDMCFIPNSATSNIQFVMDSSIVRLKSDVSCMCDALNMIWNQYRE